MVLRLAFAVGVLEVWCLGRVYFWWVVYDLCLPGFDLNSGFFSVLNCFALFLFIKIGFWFDYFAFCFCCGCYDVFSWVLLWFGVV